ncbi:MAG: hypothetical protein KatS3mg055_1844 [Chloroflexus sp.]|uniref:hypothetical protein n=1 Tax=Chloroflexus sp. TaxID=1904827 RepID=UPI0021DE6604|nr:hypothetical protein [Chloroflexus sp.]GIV89326.1 MAG: hypothetical protein KatS3mg055_1844 [Chloroflexus sp.]
MAKSELTIAELLQTLAHELDQPFSVGELCHLMKARWPVTFTEASVRDTLRWEGIRHGWVKLNRKQYMPLRSVLDGLRFRCWPRPQDIANGQLPIAHLYPFFGARQRALPLMYDEQNNVLRVHEVSSPSGTTWLALDLREWFHHHHFTVGDSLLVEVRYRSRPEMYLTYEPAAAFRADEVVAQEQALIAELVKRVGHQQVAVDEVVLPIFAGAAWRTAYPGRPWQYLVLNDRRLQLIDDFYLQLVADPFDADAVMMIQPTDESVVFSPAILDQVQARSLLRSSDQTTLLDEIASLQQAIQRSREQDRQAGIWDGRLTRESYLSEEEDDEAFLKAINEELGPFAIITSDEMAYAFLRMQEVLPPEVQEQLNHATQEEAEVIIAGQLNWLLVKAPDLFPVLDPQTIRYASDTLTDQVQAHTLSFDSDDITGLTDDDDWDDDDDLDWDDDDDDEDACHLQSTGLINQYVDYLQECGKKRSTAQTQARLLQPYAWFLASFYRLALSEGSYATLDEFLFYYYPNHYDVSERHVREMCSALKHFYAFLRERGIIQDDRFALAIWQRRDQAARLMVLTRKVEHEHPDQPQLLRMLFKSFTS